MQKNYRAYSEKTSLPSVYVEPVMNKDSRGKLTWLMCLLSRFSCVRLFDTLWNLSFLASLSMGFSKQEYWSGLPCHVLENLPNPGIEPTSHISCTGRWVL